MTMSMTTYRVFYSLVQYCPDRFRVEAVDEFRKPVIDMLRRLTA